jgi:glycine oxidase
MTEFLIVGQGLAANVLMHTFHKHNISFKVAGNPALSNCSNVAAGIWNPVVFKRLTKSWLADELVPYLDTFYTSCETLLNKKIMTQRPIIKPFTEDQEKKLWLKKSIAELNGFLDPELYEQLPPELNGCNITNGFGIVNRCGNLNVAQFLTATAQFFSDRILSGTFDYSALQVFTDHICYHAIEARHIIFCEGYLVKDNPFFSWIPLKPAKGEILTIETEGLQLGNQVFNRNGFLMDIARNAYRIGATYTWDDLSQNSTPQGLQELKDKLAQMSNCNYAVIKHEAGIRPSSIDRRPIVGKHPAHENLFVFNGLGTKGVMLAPFFANNFVNFYLQKQLLHNDVNVNRFYHLYEAQKK